MTLRELPRTAATDRSPLAAILRLTWASAPRAMRRGAALSLLALLMGVGLLGLSGWFITATGVAGAAGIGIAFDVFRPSAGVRFLALGRAAARYGERLLTHDATLRALASLRVALLDRRMGAPFEAQERLRPGPALTRLTADVDALDGVALRLVLPGAAAVLTHALVLGALGWLVHPAMAAVVLAGQGAGAGLILWRTARDGGRPSVRAERGGQRLLHATMEALRGRDDLALRGGLPGTTASLVRLGRRRDQATARLDQIGRDADAGLASVTALTAAAALVIGGWLVDTGRCDAATAAIGMFVALALQEAAALLRAGATGLGRMRDAAGRVMAEPAAVTLSQPGAFGETIARPGLSVEGLSYCRPRAAALLLDGIELQVAPGEALALAAPSGAGKSTILRICAGLIPASAGTIRLDGRPLPLWPEPELRAHLTLVPQRAALIGGSVRDNLALARDALPDDEARAVLTAVGLDPVLGPRGGLDAQLGEGGAGLSGGEARRLVLARALLRRPQVLLLDEPTEGLDADAAGEVLAAIRRILPGAAILCAAHNPVEIAWCDRLVHLKPRD